MRLTEGYAAAAPALTRALELFLALEVADRRGRPLALARRWRASVIVALELWDAESWHVLAARQAQFARDTGALVHLQFALNFLAGTHLLAGELTTAALTIDEDRLIAEATGNPPLSTRDVARGLARPGGAGLELIEARCGRRPQAVRAGCQPRGLRERSALQRPRSPRRRARRRLASIRARSGGVRAFYRARAGRGGVQDR